ncbi:hypothetical protein [Ignatzschineria sp. LJL83]
MVNRGQKEEVLKCLEQHYISPLTQFYAETEVLKRILLGRPFRPYIGAPDSWRLMHIYQSLRHLTSDEALHKLWLFDRYLSSAGLSVFAFDKPLILSDSIPYFEWQEEGRLQGLQQFFGKPRVFFFCKPQDESILQYMEVFIEQDVAENCVIVGELPESIIKVIREKGGHHISMISRPFLENIGKGRSFTSLFSQSVDFFVMDACGQYTKAFSKPEFFRQLEQIKEQYLKDDRAV